MPVPELPHADRRFVIGQGETLREGGDIAIVANGTLVHRALAAAEALAAAGVAARVINMASIAPLDTGLLADARSEEHTSELQSLMRISYAVFCLKKKNEQQTTRSAALDTDSEHQQSYAQ